MQDNSILPQTPRIRSYVRTGTYTPKSGPLAGRTFTGTPGTSQAYNLYQAARSKALGYSGYSAERQARSALSRVFKEEQGLTRYGPAGKLSTTHRVEILQKSAPFWNLETRGFDFTDPTTGKPDRRIGGKLDLWLQAIGRRNGTETWPPGAS